MKIGSIGYNHSHDRSFVMDRPAGQGAWLFLLVKSTALFELDGVRQNVAANSCVLISPNTPCMYTALDVNYTDDWFYFSEEVGDMDHFVKLGLPINQIVHLGAVEELSQIMHILTYEHYSADAFHEEIEQRYLDILFMKIGRLIADKKHLCTRAFAKKNDSFTHIRSRIYTQPDSVGSVDELAAEAGMSRSGFQHMYKKMFGVSVIADVITGRVERAKRLLTSTTLTVDEIAARCGYSGSYTFIRQFKQRCGKTPTAYRKGL